MRKNLIFLSLLLLLFANTQIAKACLNDEEYHLPDPLDFTAKGALVTIQDSMQKSPEQLFEEKFKQTESKKRSVLADLQTKALRELLTGDKAAALKKFQALEEKFPGEYNTASNLGTAYELNGDNANALKWIEEGVKRNNDSHHGTEWLHALILEAKIKLETDPHYYDSRRILNLPDQLTDKNTENYFSYKDKKLTDGQVEAALAYQLKERAVFIKPTDIVVADLLFSLAKISARDQDYETASRLLDLSKLYGFKDEKLWQETFASYHSKESKSEKDATEITIGQ